MLVFWGILFVCGGLTLDIGGDEEPVGPGSAGLFLSSLFLKAGLGILFVYREVCGGWTLDIGGAEEPVGPGSAGLSLFFW